MFDEKAPTRRDLLQLAGAAGVGMLLSGCGGGGQSPAVPAELAAPANAAADVTLRISPVLVNVTKDRTISTIGYNGGAPGPVVRLKEGSPVVVEIINQNDHPELVHWHGQLIPAAIDGASEEKSLVVPALGKLRYRLTPGPSGLRFVHTHMMARADLSRGTYTGQFAPVYIEPRRDAGRYDQEVFLTTHEWEPFFTTGEMEDQEEGEPNEEEKKLRKEAEARETRPNGWEIGYRLFAINGHALGFGEPVRVKEGQRVLFHVLNASATENIRLALPGHRFQIVALDGNPIPRPQAVDVLSLGTAERIDAIVEMNNPGVWVLGTPKDDDRRDGMGIVVEYANKSGEPQWQAPPKSRWDYTIFGTDKPVPPPDQVVPMVFEKINGGTGGFNQWTINGKPFEDQGPPQELKKGLRYRLAFVNRTDDAHPLHLHRNIFELTNVYGKPTSGVMKDVVLIRPFGKIEVDFAADQPGLTLFHCHQQLHMDYGFMKVFNVV